MQQIPKRALLATFGHFRFFSIRTRTPHFLGCFCV